MDFSVLLGRNISLLPYVIFDVFICRDWRDPSWTGTRSVQEGLAKATKAQRLALFGDNIIDIEGKSTLALLIDEVCSKRLLPLELLTRECRSFIHSTYSKSPA